MGQNKPLINVSCCDHYAINEELQHTGLRSVDRFVLDAHWELSVVLGPEGVMVTKFESVPENLLHINQARLPVDWNLTYSGDPVLQKDTLRGRRLFDEGKEGQ